MSRRVRINGKRIRAMRTQPALTAKLAARGRARAARANADFDRTASKEDKRSQEHTADSPVPYDVSVRVGDDRTRVYVQTASYAARRHEKSVRGSSLLRSGE
ncbi:hypothetical protein SEA_NOSHOW_11 [Mycobacterium phage NoShow]|nr:hypothetical protein SEA_NOSHOW_11 [Mycobacterium phage NoShow]